MLWLVLLLVPYLGYGVWVHACIAHDDLERGRRSIAGGIGSVAAMCLEFYPVFLAAWPVWHYFRRPDLSARQSPFPCDAAKAESESSRPVSEFTDPKVASAVAAMREALKESGPQP